jgi:hypothetical protein
MAPLYLRDLNATCPKLKLRCFNQSLDSHEKTSETYPKK